MSFFTSLQNQQSYLQNALNSAASQADLEIQSTEAEQSLQNEDNIAAQALKSAGMSDLFLGAPVALRGLIQAPEIIQKAQEGYAGLKETYAGLKEKYATIKAKAEEVKNLVSGAPEKMKALREAAIDPSMTPESIQAKVVELFGEKIGNGAVGKTIVDNLSKFKTAHESIKAAAIEHIAAGSSISDTLDGHLKTIEGALQKVGASPEQTAEILSKRVAGGAVKGAFSEALGEGEEAVGGGFQSLISKALKSSDAIEKIHSTITGETSLPSSIPSSFSELAERGTSAIAKRTAEMTPLLERTAGEAVARSSVLQPFMEKVSSLKAATSEKLKALQAKQEEITNRLNEGVEPEIRSRLESQLTSLKGSALAEQTNIRTSNRLASLNQEEPKIVSAARGEVDLVEPKVAISRNVAPEFDPVERISPQKGSAFESLAKEGLSDTDAGLRGYYSKAKDYLSAVKDSAFGKIGGGTLGAGLEGLNVMGGVEAAKALTQGRVNAMNVLQTSQLKSAPEALQGAISTIGEGIKATGAKGASIVENATNTLNDYAARAKSTISDTFDMLKSSVAESGAEDVAKGIAEKGIGSFLGEAALGTIPILGEISDISLGIGSIVEAIKDIHKKPQVAAPQPVVVEGVQQSRQAGIY